MRIFEIEAALVIGAITAAVGLAAAFGLAVSDVQGGAIVGFVTTVLALGQALATRRKVWAEASVHRAIADSASFEDDSDRDEPH